MLVSNHKPLSLSTVDFFCNAGCLTFSNVYKLQTYNTGILCKKFKIIQKLINIR